MSEGVDMQKIEVPKEGTKTVIAYGRLEIWMKFVGVFFAGVAGLFGFQKMPIVNESTRITEAVQVVKNLNPEELSALQGVQYMALEKQVKHNNEVQIAAINELKSDIKSMLRDYDDRTVKRLDKHGELILNNIKAIARIEALVPKARAGQ